MDTKITTSIFESGLMPIVTIIVSGVISYFVARSQKNHERLMESYRLYVIEKQKIYNIFWQKLLKYSAKIEAVEPLDASQYYNLEREIKNQFTLHQLFFSKTVYDDCIKIFNLLTDAKALQTISADTIGSTSSNAKKTRKDNPKKWYEIRNQINNLTESVGENMRKELSAGYDHFELKK